MNKEGVEGHLKERGTSEFSFLENEGGLFVRGFIS